MEGDGAGAHPGESGEGIGAVPAAGVQHDLAWTHEGGKLLGDADEGIVRHREQEHVGAGGDLGGRETSTSGRSVWMRSCEAGERPLTPTIG